MEGLLGSICRSSCQGKIICDVCGTVHNSHIEEEEDDSGDYSNSESIPNVDFAGMQVCYCCFKRIDQAILSLMPYAIALFIEKLKEEHEWLHNMEDLIAELKSALEK